MNKEKEIEKELNKENSNSVLGKLKGEYFQIESNDTLSTEQKVSRIINYTAAACAAIAIQPIPFADFFVLTPIQAYMGTRLAAIYGIKIKEQKATEIVKQIGGTVGLGVLAQQLVIGAYKTVIPFLGAVTTIPLVYGMTFAIGKVMQCYFKARSEGRELTDREMKNIWKESFKKGKKQGEVKKDSIKEDDAL